MKPINADTKTMVDYTDVGPGKRGLFASWREKSCCCLGFLPRHSWGKVVLGVCCVRAFCPFDFYLSSCRSTAMNKEQACFDFTFSWIYSWKGECMLWQLSTGQGSQCCLQPWVSAAQLPYGVGDKTLGTGECWYLQSSILCFFQVSVLSSRNLLASPSGSCLI